MNGNHRLMLTARSQMRQNGYTSFCSFQILTHFHQQIMKYNYRGGSSLYSTATDGMEGRGGHKNNCLHYTAISVGIKLYLTVEGIVRGV